MWHNIRFYLQFVLLLFTKDVSSNTNMVIICGLSKLYPFLLYNFRICLNFIQK